MTTSGVSFTRREFALTLASGTALTVDQASSAMAREVSSDRVPAPPPKPENRTGSKREGSPENKATTGEPPEPPPEAAYLIGLIMRRYSDERLDETAITGIVRDIYGDLARSRILSSFPLDNSDEPGFTFKAWRAD